MVRGWGLYEIERQGVRVVERDREREIKGTTCLGSSRVVRENGGQVGLGLDLLREIERKWINMWSVRGLGRSREVRDKGVILDECVDVGYAD